MANKVIQFSQSSLAKKIEDNVKEVFLDIDMKAKLATVYRHNTTKTMPELSDCWTMLGAENSDVSVVTEQTLANIALFPDDSYIKPNYYTTVSAEQTLQINKLVNVNAIRNSLDNIFSWTPGERILNPEFGTNLRKLLYEGITDFNVEQIVAEIKHAVAQWEPRVQVANIVDVSTTEDHENNTVHLKVIYTIPGLSDQQFAYDYVTPTERA